MPDSETQIPDRRVPGERGRAADRPSREELVRVRERDPEALGRFFDRYADRVYGLAYRMLGDVSAAEDVTQEVFLKVHRACDRLDPDRDPAPWLTTITCNACREHWRSRHTRAASRAVPLEEIADRHADGRAEDPAGELDRERRAGRVQRALMALPEGLREVVLLHDWQGYSHQEIAELLGATYVAIRKRYSRALAALGNRLREDGMEGLQP